MPCKRERASLWCPQWEGTIEKWTRKFISENAWRYDTVHTFDDLLQEFYLVFIKIRNRYPRVIDEPHFFSLYRTAVTNRTHDLAAYVQRKRSYQADTPQDVSDLDLIAVGDVSNDGFRNILISEMPEELRMAALAIINGVPKPKRKRGEPRKNLNQYLRELTGINKDFVGELRAHFTA